MIYRCKQCGATHSDPPVICGSKMQDGDLCGSFEFSKTNRFQQSQDSDVCCDVAGRSDSK